MSTLGDVSVPVVKQYLRYVETIDVDIKPILAAANIPVSILAQEHERISGEQLQMFLLTLIQQTGDPLFGLKSGQYVQPGSYSVLGYISMTCATLSEVIERIAPYEKLVGDMGVTTVECLGEQIALRWHSSYPSPIVRAHMTDNVFASWVSYVRWLSGLNIGPQQVNLQREQPAPSVMIYYQKIFGCPVCFGQPYNALIITPDYMDICLTQPDPDLRRTLEDHALIQMSTLSDAHSMSVRVTDTIRVLLRSGNARKTLVAEQLGISVKTLQRKLQSESTTYQTLLDEARLSLAQEYLQNELLSLEDIAIRLGFSEIRSFFRSFKAWTNQTPSEFREAKQHE